MQPRKQLMIAREMPAIQQRNREFGIGGFESRALGQRACGRAELQTQVPQVLRKFAQRFFEFLFRAVPRVQKQHVYVRKGEEPAPPEAAQRDYCKIRGSVRLRENVLLPQALDDGFDQRGPTQQSGLAVSRRGKQLFDARQFLRRYLAQFAGN